MSSMKNLFLVGLLAAVVALSGCEKDAPNKENEEELINKVTLTFSPVEGGSDIVVVALDEDGEGLVIGTINLIEHTTYDLFITFENTLEGEDITEEIEEEADEHMIFFAFSIGAFASPDGNGNIDNRADPVNYEDEDSNGQPLGLHTSWTTSVAGSSFTFTVLLKHQPGLKTGTSGANVGETDVNVTFPMQIAAPAH
jgi:hypothetical protein